MLRLNDKLKPTNQKGLASIIVVAVLVVLMTLISIGFARLMSRSVANSTNNELSIAATDAAQSGINDTLGLIEHNIQNQPPGTDALESPKCNSLIGTNGKINPNFAGNSNERYTCITASTQLTNLIYSKIPPNESQVIQMTTTSKVNNLELSWQSADSPPQSSFPASGTSLLDETTWNKDNYAPLMEVSLYPIIDDSTDIVDSTLASASRTYYLYPSSAGNANSNIDYSQQSGSLAPVSCSTTTGKTITDFGSSDYNCNLVITNLQSATSPGPLYFYLRLTPIYDSAAVELQATDATNTAVKFTNVQAMIDVTAQANTATKRLQARVELNTNSVNASSNNLPDDGLRSAETICKHLQIEQNGNVNIDGQTCNNQLHDNNPLPPSIDFCGDLSTNTSCTGNTPTTPNIQDQQAITLNWSVGGTAPVTCTTSTTDPAGWSSGPTSAGNGTYTTGALSGGSSGSTDAYSITCSNAAGTTGPVQVTVTVGAAPSSGGCSSNCGGGGGGGDSVSIIFDPATPNSNAFLYALGQPAYCVVTDDEDQNTGLLLLSQNNGRLDLGAGNATNATMTCYNDQNAGTEVGSGTANRTTQECQTSGTNCGSCGGGGCGCAFYPVTDMFGNVINCVGATDLDCNFYQCFVCQNTGGDPPVNCTSYGNGGCTDNGGTVDPNDMNHCIGAFGGGSGGPVYNPPPVYGCTDPSASNYNPYATIDDGSCIPPSCPSGEDRSPNDGMCYSAGETDSWGCLDYGDGNWSC